MGAANKVPGVSGGTVSFVLGFYEELIYSFQKVNLKALKLLLAGEFKKFYHYTNAQFIFLVMGLILLGNYVLLLVDSVNVLLNVMGNLLTGNFDVLSDPIKMRYLKIIAVFTSGSAFGLVTISHLLGYVLKHYNKIVNAVIIGFITGSLGIVWPWKKTIYVTDNGVISLDTKGNKIVENYERFIPEILNLETVLALFFIFLGIGLILAIDYYDRRRKK